jgi:hypothetical protein
MSALPINKFLRSVNIFFSLLSIVLLLTDYFITTEFFLEPAFTVMTILFFGLNILRLTVWKSFYPVLFDILMNIAIAALLLFDLRMLSIFLFGVGFTGRETPFIMTAAVFHIYGYLLLILVNTVYILFRPSSK